MRINSKKKHLRWLVPLIIYFVALAILLVSFRNYYYEQKVREKELEMAFAIEREIDNIDFSVGRAITTVSEAGAAFSLYAFRYNQNQIRTLLAGIVNDTDVTDVFVCNLEGHGYDYRGKDVRIDGEKFFFDISAEYSRGGVGLMFPDIPDDQPAYVYIVCGVSFDRKERGYIIAKLPVVSIADQIFALKYEADTLAIITIDGRILSMESRGQNQQKGDKNFYDLLPQGVSRDNIKLSITQKSIYYADAPGFGYMIVLPLDTANACAIALINYDDMRLMANREIQPFKSLAVGICIASLALIVLIILANMLAEYLHKLSMDKKYAEAETDVVTGLLTGRAAFKAIDEYIESDGDAKGMMFLILLSLDALREGNGDYNMSPDKIKEFAEVLAANYRSTDIIARTGEEEFLVFLKDIREDKDVRKQTDHLQMFLHDSRIIDEGKEVAASAGAAVCPVNGKSAEDLMNAAKAALDRARKEGIGRLSF